jgi:hypothetical protein
MIIITIAVGVVAFVAGVLVGRANKNKVEKAVAEIKSVEDKIKKSF